ncbi:hypothetical protein OBBRIDRAFT_788281 [Obba rivulosa]|uniref:Uncharacterized protein n=1 Tax=Obba rivulosa TaxID=1052685 RepID=A0A8E2DTI1_9APHY|nr:hypothetical protein OBBRIDRAFT_788281 [Obba rivulosa]
MLLPPIHRTLPKAQCKRRYSSHVSKFYPSSKTRAYPFQMTKDQALSKLGLVGNVLGAGDNFWGSLGAFVLPGRGFTPYQPKSIQAVYLPAWFIDAEVQAHVWESKRESDDSVKQTVTAFTSNSYMPGFSIEPLSRISLNCDALTNNDTVPWSDHLSVQNGEHIICQPFTVAPLALRDAARSLSLKQAQITEGFRLDPSSVDVQMLAAYPVLIPVWLAQYEQHWTPGQSSTLTLCVEAWNRWGPRVFAEVPEGAFGAATTQFWPVRMITSEGAPDTAVYGPYREETQEFANMNLLCKSDSKNRSARLNEWINNAAGRQNAIRSYESRYYSQADGATIDWDDLRIREFSDEEVSQNREYLSLGTHVSMLRNIVDTLSSTDEHSKVIAVSINFGKKKQEDSTESGSSLPRLGGLQEEDAVKFLKAQLEKAQEKRETKRPEWLTEWINRTRTRSEDSKEH